MSKKYIPCEWVAKPNKSLSLEVNGEEIACIDIFKDGNEIFRTEMLDDNGDVEWSYHPNKTKAEAQLFVENKLGIIKLGAEKGKAVKKL